MTSGGVKLERVCVDGCSGQARSRYHPEHLADQDTTFGIARACKKKEIAYAESAARSAGLSRFDERGAKGLANRKAEGTCSVSFEW